MSRVTWSVVAAALLGSTPAHATYSITATDQDASLVGGAGASCVPYEVIVIYASAPGHGALNIQAGFDDAARDAAKALLGDGVAPDEVIAAVTDPSFDPEAPQMQYGVVDLEGRAAGYTGPEAQPYAGHRTGAVGPYTYATQGNLLTSARVLEQAAAAFEERGCDLVEKLMLALEAGADEHEGDSRCTGEGLPAKSAYLQVDRAGEPAGSFLRISVPDVTPQDPIAALRAQLDVWRLDHPCPEPVAPDDAQADESSAGGCRAAGGATPIRRTWTWWALALAAAALRRRSSARVAHSSPL